MKPYYSDELVTIYHGDSREWMPETDAVLTDPPYGIDGGRGGDARDFGKGRYLPVGWSDTPAYIQSVVVPIIRALRRGRTPMAVTPGVRTMFLYPTPDDIGCFWTPAAATHGPWGFTTFQPILYYGKDWRAGRGALPSGRLLTEQAEPNGHPCPKPIEGWTWLLGKVSGPGSTVLDPFMGSGTTLVAAKSLGRKAIGIEIEERYCEIAATRCSQEVLGLVA